MVKNYYVMQMDILFQDVGQHHSLILVAILLKVIVTEDAMSQILICLIPAHL